MVDDDAEDRVIVLDALKQLNKDSVVDCAENGEVAMNMLNENGASGNYPCLVVLDLNMPKMNGTNTLRKLKADPRFRDIPVVVYTTSVNPLEKEVCMKLGAQSYLTKPLSYKESLEMARLFLGLCGVRSFV